MANIHNVFISHYGEDEKQLDDLKRRLKEHGCDARNSSVEKKDYDNKRHSDECHSSLSAHVYPMGKDFHCNDWRTYSRT